MVGDDGWSRGRRRIVSIGAGAVVAVAAAAVVVAVNRGPDTIDDVGGPVAAARTADHRPHGPALRNAPYDCGMSPAVLDRLAGGAEKTEQQSIGSDRCTWGGVTGGNRLEVDLEFSATDAGRPDPSEALGDFTRMISTGKASSTDRTGPVTALTGLGADAVGWTAVAEVDGTPLTDRAHPRVWHGRASTTIAFQAGNVAAQVTYGVADRTKDGVDLTAHPLETTTRDGALAAATSLARQIGAPVRGTPAEARTPAGPVARTLPAACSIAAAGTVRTAADNPELKPERDDGNSLEDGDTGLDGDRCAWSGGLGRSVDVEWALAGEPSPTGDAATAARRVYDQRYLSARDTPEGTPDQSVFTALKGLGDQAFAAYEKDEDIDGGDGVVLVRKRNALIRVRCWTIDPYSPDDALNCAYAVARAAAGRVEA